ncbi:Rv2231c family pyridoxal phosphate-dependent protein CobC [Amycolatopsis magusensis]|uniref:Aminotransferase n=1 Tax=Amycolatopsis magusensis TaxID=882444 RepID=A0ABS4PRG7_9PSEU|nr:Rv2231c family pyridoxal phosphate-dependent protein CobC [Amycolatopsis magusensis]MBP2182024.1 histidinol-phosphate aminotransferase [Amycolatopsis magusensis]
MVDLWHHGDREVGPGLVDLAVNVRLAEPPDWLITELTAALPRLAAYPDSTEATEAVAARHGRSAGDVLVTSGAAEAFTLIARGLGARRACVVHPQFTEPEAALLAAEVPVSRVLLRPEDGFTLGPVPEDADLVVVGNPTNPTSVLHPASSLRALCRPGRVVVVDEAFLDSVPGEPETLAGEAIPGLLVIRSLTKTWGIAGLRAGYVLGPAELIDRLRAVQPPWSVSALAAVAVVACCRPEALKQADELAVAAEADREFLLTGLRELGVAVHGVPRAPFVLGEFRDGAQVRETLRDRGYAVRRGDTFPGLGPDWLRIAVRSRPIMSGFLTTLRDTTTQR